MTARLKLGRSSRLAMQLGLALAGAALLGASCGPPTDPAVPGPAATASATTRASSQPPDPKPDEAPSDEVNVGVALPGLDVCATKEDGSLENPIEPGTYSGILRNAKCEQQKFITMARVAQSLGVKCNHCHVPDPDDANKEIYPEMTDNKRIANWMSRTFIQGLVRADGEAMRCASCHNDKDGKPTAKILQEPRDGGYAQEWMGEVMTVAFTEKSGKRLKCKTCHVGAAPGLPGFVTDVIKRLNYTGEGVERKKDGEE